MDTISEKLNEIELQLKSIQIGEVQSASRVEEHEFEAFNKLYQAYQLVCDATKLLND